MAIEQLYLVCVRAPVTHWVQQIVFLFFFFFVPSLDRCNSHLVGVQVPSEIFAFFVVQAINRRLLDYSTATVNYNHIGHSSHTEPYIKFSANHLHCSINIYFVAFENSDLICGFVECQHPHRCVLNPYYNPVCGTDRRTYGNKDILACINRQRPHSRRK